MRVADAWRHGAARLAAAGIDTPRIDARLLLMQSAGLTRVQLLSDAARTIVDTLLSDKLPPLRISPEEQKRMAKAAKDGDM